MPARSLLVFCSMLLLITAACPRSSQTAAALDAPPGPCQLVLADGVLTLCSAGQQLAELSSTGTVPYRIIRESDPAIVTTCGADLVPRTFVIGDELLQFDDMVPQIVEPPVIALFTIAAEEDTPGGRVVLIGPDGSLAYQNYSAELLLPEAGAAAGPVLAAPTEDSFLQPFGETPAILAVDPGTGKLAWRAEPPVRGAPDDIELLCAGDGYGLLSLQYGYTMFEYLSVDLATGEFAQLYLLGGQPFVTISQPGAMPAYRGLAIEGSTAELLVFDEKQGAGQLTFDLAQGTAEFSAREVTGPVTVEDNVLPVGGGLASPDAPPYPQSLLPVEYGENWTIPALTNGRNVLVIDAEGASWVKF